MAYIGKIFLLIEDGYSLHSCNHQQPQKQCDVQIHITGLIRGQAVLLCAEAWNKHRSSTAGPCRVDVLLNNSCQYQDAAVTAAYTPAGTLTAAVLQEKWSPDAES